MGEEVLYQGSELSLDLLILVNVIESCVDDHDYWVKKTTTLIAFMPRLENAPDCMYYIFNVRLRKLVRGHNMWGSGMTNLLF